MWVLLLLLACDEAPQYPMDTFQSLPMAPPAPPDTSENTWVYVAGGPEPVPVEMFVLQAQVQVQEQEIDRLNSELEAILLHLKQQSTTASEKPLQ